MKQLSTKIKPRIIKERYIRTSGGYCWDLGEYAFDRVGHVTRYKKEEHDRQRG